MAQAPLQGGAIRLEGRADGFAFEAYHVRTPDVRRGGLVVLHAIWGVTPHICELCDGFAEDGYETIAPSLFDRTDPGFPAVNMDLSVRDRRSALAAATDWTVALGDIQACIDALAPPVFVAGFCFGGTAAWLAAARCSGLAGAACFYGGGVAANLAARPVCPTILHFGKRDPLIPMTDVEAVISAHPELPVWLYEAGHAFMAPSDYDADSAKLARLRTLQHFHRAAGPRGERGG